MPRPDFLQRYGPWVLVSGAAQGLGEAFARQLAGEGLDLILLDRQEGPLMALANDLRQQGREVRTVVADLASPDFLPPLIKAAEGCEVGLLIACAAHSIVDPFFARSAEEHERTINVNVRATLLLTEHFGRPMLARKRGGILLLSSASALQGTALVATYAATKAWNLVLAESLWAELQPHGVDVLGFMPGATDTPAFRATGPKPSKVAGMTVMDSESTVREALAYLGRGPSRVAGRANRWAGFFTGRLLGRRRAIGIYRDAMHKLYQRDQSSGL